MNISISQCLKDDGLEEATRSAQCREASAPIVALDPRVLTAPNHGIAPPMRHGAALEPATVTVYRATSCRESHGKPARDGSMLGRSGDICHHATATRL